MGTHDFRDEIAAKLPAAAADEPVALRQSIEDELSDHLQCAVQHEQLKGRDAATAREHALQRFGNVSSVAWQLWLDAMRPHLWSRRLLMLASLVLLVACCSIAIAGWISNARLHDAVATAMKHNRETSQQLQQSQQRNLELIKQLALLSKQNEGSQNTNSAVDEQADEENNPAVPAGDGDESTEGPILNSDFEETDGENCVHWRLVKADESNPFAGSRSGKFAHSGGGQPIEVTSQFFQAAPYRGKRIRFRAAVRVESGKAQLWCRIDRPKDANGGIQMGDFDNMGDRPILESDWQRHEIVLDVADDATGIALGLFVQRNTTAWIDAAEFVVVDDSVPTTTMEIPQATLRNQNRDPQQVSPDLSSEIKNGDMESVADDSVQIWNLLADTEKPFAGQVSGKIQPRNQGDSNSMTAAASQVLDAKPWRGKRIRFRAAVRTESNSDGKAQLWCRVDRVSKSGRPAIGAFDNMSDRPITNSEWKHYEIVLDVNDDADKIFAGILLMGDATAWMDDVSLEQAGDSAAKTTSMMTSSPDAPQQSFFSPWLWLVLVAVTLFGLSHKTKATVDGEKEHAGFFAKFAFRFTVAYWLLYFIPQPFNRIIPGLNEFTAWYQSHVQKVVLWTASSVLGIDHVPIRPTGSGDTTFDFVRIFVVFSLSLLIGVLWSAVDWRKTNYAWTKDLFRSYLRYMLALTMLGYGLSKSGFVMNQFPTLSEYHLDRTYGDSSPMGLVWTFMGASRPYTIFSGLAECLGALLLIWRRTTMLGAMVTFGVMLNVVMLNFCYDVPVKQFSTHLLCMSLLLALPDARRLAGMLLFNKPTEPAAQRPPYAPGYWVWLPRAIKVAVIVMGVGLPIYSKAKTEIGYASAIANEPIPMATYEVESATENGKPIDAAFETARFQRDPFWRGEGSPKVNLFLSGNNGGEQFAVTFEGETMALEGNSRLLKSVNLKVTKVDHGTYDLGSAESDVNRVVRIRPAEGPYLLTNRGFRWVNELPYNR